MNTPEPSDAAFARAFLPGPKRSAAISATWLPRLALGALIAIAFANSFQAALVLDNKLIIGNDPRIRAWSAENLRLILTKGYWWPSLDGDLYRPVTTLSYLFNCAGLGNGTQVGGYHGVNLLLHWINACLVFALLQRVARSTRVAFIAAAIFSIHPITVEAVTNIVGRADLLATLSILTGLWCYVRANETSGPPRRWWLVAVGATTVIGVFAKENAVMIGPLLVIYDWLFRWPKLQAPSSRSRLVLAIREFGLKGWIAVLPSCALLFLVRWWLAPALITAGQPFADNPIAYAPRWSGTLTAIQVIGRDFGLLVFPRTLSADYSYNQIPLYSLDAPVLVQLFTWGSLLAILGLLVVMIRSRQTNVGVAWAIAAFFALLLPTSNLLVPIGSVMAERFLYLPSIGFALLAGIAFVAVLDRLGAAMSGVRLQFRMMMSAAFVTIVIAALMIRTFARNADWRDELTLWRSAVAASPNSVKVHEGYANALFRAHEDERSLDAALVEATIGLSILDHPLLPIERRDQTLYDTLGHFHRAKGEFLEHRKLASEARRHFVQSAEFFERAIEVNRWNSEARRQAVMRRVGQEVFDLGDYRIREQLALTYVHLGAWEKLAATAAEIRKLAPSVASGYLLGGVAAANSRKFDEGAVLFIAGLILQPGNAEIFQNLVTCYQGLGAQPVPVSNTSAGLNLDLAHPLARRHVNEAFALLVRGNVAAGLFEQAARLRDMAMQRFHVPADLVTITPGFSPLSRESESAPRDCLAPWHASRSPHGLHRASVADAAETELSHQQESAGLPAPLPARARAAGHLRSHAGVSRSDSAHR